MKGGKTNRKLFNLLFTQSKVNLPLGFFVDVWGFFNVIICKLLCILSLQKSSAKDKQESHDEQDLNAVFNAGRSQFSIRFPKR